MLSSYIKKQQSTALAVRSSTTATSGDSTKAINTTLTASAGAAKGLFVPTANLSVINDTVVLTIPEKIEGKIWDTWRTTVRKLPNNQEGFSQLITLAKQLQVDAQNRVDNCKNTVNNIQSLTSFFGAALQIVEIALAGAAFDTVSYSTVQVILSSVTGGGSLLFSHMSSQAITIRNDALAYQIEVNELLSAQLGHVPVPIHISPTPGPQPSKTVADDKKEAASSTSTEAPADTTTLIPSTSTNESNSKDKKIIIADISVQDGSFITTPNVTVNGSKVDISLPTVKEGYLWDTWQKALEILDNTPAKYTDFFITLVNKSAALDNRINKYDQAISSIQSFTSVSLALFAVAKIAVTTFLPTATSNQVFQIVGSSAASAISLGSKFFSSKVIDTRNNAIDFKNYVTTEINDQYKPKQA